MFFNLKDKFHRYGFAKACQQIFSTAPVSATTDQPVAVLTQLQHKDVMLFLVAIKTFAKQIPLAKVFIINDGSLTADDFTVLLEHIPIAEFHDAKEFAIPECPTGGCWERLLAIAHFVEQFFIIQLDGDTLTLSALEEVKECIATATGFVLGSWDGQEIETMGFVSERALGWIREDANMQNSVQVLAEASFSKIYDNENLRYARGCAGFSGFPKGSFDKQFIIDFSTKMEKEIGNNWYKWGSEQVMSNVVVANLEKAAILPYPKYKNANMANFSGTCFIHFIGYCRFNGSLFGGSMYANLARDEIGKIEQIRMG